MSNLARKTVLALVLLEALEEGDETKTRGKPRKWRKRRDDKGFYQNIVRELRMEYTQGYKEMSFHFLLVPLDVVTLFLKFYGRIFIGIRIYICHGYKTVVFI